MGHYGIRGVANDWFKSYLSNHISTEKIVFSVHTNLDFVHQTRQSQLLSIVHDIYASFDQSLTLEVRVNVLDISKSFDKVWHEGLIFKLEHIGISGNLPKSS